MADKTAAEQLTTDEPKPPEADSNGRSLPDAEVAAPPLPNEQRMGRAVPVESALPPALPVPPPKSIPAARGAEIGVTASPPGWAQVLLRQTPSWMISMVLHVVALVILALLTVPSQRIDALTALVVAPSRPEELSPLELPDEPLEEIDPSDVRLVVEPTAVVEKIDIAAANDLSAATMSVELRDIGLETVPKDDLLASMGGYEGDALAGRGVAKARLISQAGGNEMSERAVAAALKWIVEHQYPDGGWNLNLAGLASCRGRCRNSATTLPNSRNAATALALLPLLGAGHTQKTGKYSKAVRKGLYFLIKRMQVSPQGGSLFEAGGTMYSHGLASIVLCEAYAMTDDRELYDAALRAVNFICFAQDPIGGGWRYFPQTPGDTSVVGWQLMALKSGQMGYLPIPPTVVRRASFFLDTVQDDDGAIYVYKTGYQSPDGNEATTAIGLLCRMYLGWKRDHPALQRGVEMLTEAGPSKTDLYYNYYATQVLRHWEGDLWQKWNEVMRDQLIESQVRKGHESGSWYVPGDFHSELGGRLYCTSMATMILEVYYRHLPIYRKESTLHDFPLE